MNTKKGLFMMLLTLSATACIQDEALNAEADIETVTLPKSQLLLLNRDPVIENERVKLLVKENVKKDDLRALAPVFSLTPGATIEPASGTVRDFTQPQHYTVTSQDRQWSKTYEVKVFYSGIPLEYHFENAMPVYGEGKRKGQIIYYNFFENDANENFLEWTNANAGFDMTGQQISADDYPTSPCKEGKVGNCVKLTTKNTGGFGSMLGMSLAAGNLFMGHFEPKLGQVLESTEFGVPFTHIPTKISGWYKYKSGSKYTNGNQVIEGKKDIFDIYGIFYETDENVKMLNGTNQFDHPNLVSIARIDHAHETDEWTQFEIPFVLKPGKQIDPAKLKAGKYNFALVFSSSIRGDYFEGAEGSTLFIDEVKVSIQE